jgi:hypothetical protein
MFLLNQMDSFSADVNSGQYQCVGERCGHNVLLN